MLEHHRLPGAAIERVASATMAAREPGHAQRRRRRGRAPIVALLENGQFADGSVELPQALLAYGAPASLPPAP